MTTLREAAQALIDYDDAGPDDGKGGWLHWDAKFDALRAALAEPQEPSSEMLEALQIIATPQRPDGTWNRDREACRQLAAEALGFHNKGDWK